MRIWDAMELLDKDPSRKFEYQDDKKKWLLYAEEASYDDLVFYRLDCWDNKGELMTGTVFGGLDGNLTTSDNWQPVREPITWQEAIQAWADGKMVAYSYTDRADSHIRYLFEGSHTMMTTAKIKNAKWYVEDEE